MLPSFVETPAMMKPVLLQASKVSSCIAPKLWPTSWAKVNELWSNSASWPLFRNVTKPELWDFLRNFLQNLLPKVLIKAHFHKNFIFFRFINKSFDKKLKKVYLHYLTNFFPDLLSQVFTKVSDKSPRTKCSNEKCQLVLLVQVM